MKFPVSGSVTSTTGLCTGGTATATKRRLLGTGGSLTSGRTLFLKWAGLYNNDDSATVILLDCSAGASVTTAYGTTNSPIMIACPSGSTGGSVYLEFPDPGYHFQSDCCPIVNGTATGMLYAWGCGYEM